MAIAVHPSGAELQQLSSFYRLLNQASTSRSEREVIRVFVEALAVWHDAESWVYVADVTGRFVLDVSLPSSDRTRVPSIIAKAALPGDSSRPMKVSSDLQALGFPSTSNLLMAPLQVRGASDWLLVTEHPGGTDAEARLGVYVQAVVQVLNELGAVHASRLTWAILEHVLPANESLVYAAQSAVDELSSSVDAAAWLSVRSTQNVPVLTAGDFMSRLSRQVPARMPGELSLPLEVSGYNTTLGIRRAGGRPLTGRDEQLLRLTAATLTTWLNASIARLPIEVDRRGGSRTFEQVLKHRLDAALAEGEPVSVLVVSLGREVPCVEVAHGCIGRIRRELRPADVAGRLSSGHIGILLPDTPPAHATAVIDRLRRVLDANPPSGATALSIDLVRLRGTALDRLTAEPADH